MNAVSLFSNCGAGDVGYAAAGFRFRVMAELDPRRLAVAGLNHVDAALVDGDLRLTWPQVVERYEHGSYGELELLAACPPCQGVSSANNGRGQAIDADAGSRDGRNLLVLPIAEVAVALRPKAIVLENVIAFLTRKVRHPVRGEPISAARLLIELLTHEYEVFPFQTDLADYGVPQSRVRAFLTFIRRDVIGLERLCNQKRAPYPRPTHEGAHTTVRQALLQFGLPALDASCEELASSDVPFHFVPVWDDHHYAMTAAIPPDSGGSAWENDVCAACGFGPVSRTRAHCSECEEPLLRPIVPSQNGRFRLVRGFKSTSYRRMRPGRPAPTITTASGHLGSATTIHPWENRVLSPRECTLLQTFPQHFEWGNAWKENGTGIVRDMIGEAVPPLFTALHGQAVAGVLQDRWTLAPISQFDVRCQRAAGKVGVQFNP